MAVDSGWHDGLNGGVVAGVQRFFPCTRWLVEGSDAVARVVDVVAFYEELCGQ